MFEARTFARSARPSFAEAIDIVVAASPLLPIARVPLDEGCGLVLAEDVRARDDYPRFDASAMDGFALRSACSASATDARPVELLVRGEARAGSWPEPLEPGYACPISTGAPICDGADTVLVAEAADLIETPPGLALRLSSPVASGKNIRRRGEDVGAGEVVLKAGAILRARAVGALASYGVHTVAARRPPLIAVLTAGDELEPVGTSLSPAQLYDSNGPMIEALAKQAGLPVVRVPVVGDHDDLIGDQLDGILERHRPDIIVSTGGVSIGPHDRIPAVLAARCAAVHFQGVRMKPGKPVIFATLPGRELFFGLPGNPVASFLGFRFLVMAAIRCMMGVPNELGERVETAQAARADATQFLKSRTSFDDDGCRRVTVVPGQQSHMLRSLLHANAWLVIAEDAAGKDAWIFPLEPSLG